MLKGRKILVVGGLGAGGTVLGAAELHDPSTGQWSSAGSLTMARFGHTATVLKDGRVLVAGGCAANPCTAPTAGSELYDPAANSWSTTGSLGAARLGHTAVLLGTGKVLAIGGEVGGAASSSCELFNAATGKWVAAATLPVTGTGVDGP